MHTSIHFEGLPGSGKTTASERFCGLLRSNGIDASWWREEAPDHPITRKEGHALNQQHDFPQNSLEAWLAFLKLSNNAVVFDGYALQSTVRFLYANHVARTQIEDYFNRWQALASDTALIYFSVENPREHFDVVIAERGDVWANKLFSYVENTPVGLANGLQGRRGFVEFWSNYQRLCHALLDRANVPVHLISARSWDDDDLEGLAIQVGLLPERLRASSPSDR